MYVRSGLNLVGLISLSSKDVGASIHGVPIVATLDKMREFIQLEKISQIIFSTQSISYESIIKSMSQIGNVGVDFKIIPQNLEVMIGKSSVEKLSDYQLVDVDYAIGKAYNRVVKRLFDFTLSVIILIPAVVFWLLPMIIQKVRDKKIEIWGENGDKELLIQYKNEPFKGMINKLFLIFYIFSGKLSFVGAPLIQTSEKQPNYFYKPGLFGLVSLNRQHIKTANQQDKYDLFYLKNQNIWLDLEIILKSLFN
jgi:lipopolysaccharide/colanic/teichoic acid biosynthesis glycosyltransferase